MAIAIAYPGMPASLGPKGEALSRARTNALMKNDTFEAIRLVILGGHEDCHTSPAARGSTRE